MSVTFPRNELLQLRALTQPCGFAMLTNLSAEGVMLSRPMTPLEMDACGAFWFFTDWRHVELEDLGPANLVFTNPKTGGCVSISGRCEIHVDRLRIERLRRLSARLPDAEAADARNLTLLKFVSVSAEVWDASHETMRRMFDHPESVQSARVIQLRPYLARPVVRPQAQPSAASTAFARIQHQQEMEQASAAA